MPPRVMRRTPATEEAMAYGYRSFLQDIVAQAGKSVERMTSGGLGKEELLEMALGGVGGVTKLTKTPKAARELMRLFQKRGLRHDAYVEQIPGMGYHQWTLYGEGPTKGATFGTKTTELGEMEGKIADLMRKFRKKPKLELAKKSKAPEGEWTFQVFMKDDSIWTGKAKGKNWAEAWEKAKGYAAKHGEVGQSERAKKLHYLAKFLKKEKKSWEMTRDEFYKSKGFKKTPSKAEISHWYEIDSALRQGKSVPAEVLAEYPELKF